VAITKEGGSPCAVLRQDSETQHRAPTDSRLVGLVHSVVYIISEV